MENTLNAQIPDKETLTMDEAIRIAQEVVNSPEPPARKCAAESDAETRLQTRAPEYIRGESSLTSRGYSFARIAYAVCTGDWSQAKVELDIHRMLVDAGLTPTNNGIVVPLNADFLEKHNATRDLFNGWLKRAMTVEYRPSYKIAQKLLQLRGQQQGVPNLGGFLVDAVVAPDFIELLRDNTVVEKAGARVINFPKSGQLIFKRQAGGATGYWVGEGETIPESDVKFGQLTMTEKYLGIVVKASNQLIQHATPDIETIIREDMAATAGLTQDLAFLRGVGSSTSPQGILHTPGVTIKYITSTGGSGGNGRAITPEDLIEMRGIVRKNMKRQQGSLAFIFNSDFETELLKLRADAINVGDKAGAFLFGGGLREADPDQLLRIPYFITEQIPSNLTFGTASNCTEIYLGDFSEAIIARGATAEIVANQSAENAYLKNETWFRMILGVDFALRHPEGFCVARGATVTVL